MMVIIDLSFLVKSWRQYLAKFVESYNARYYQTFEGTSILSLFVFLCFFVFFFYLQTKFLCLNKMQIYFYHNYLFIKQLRGLAEMLFR